MATISGSSSTRGAPPNRVELWGEDGTVRLEPKAAAYTERAVDGLPAGRWTPLPVEAVDRHAAAFVERFAAAIARGAEPDVTPADGAGGAGASSTPPTARGERRRGDDCEGVAA